MNVVIECVYVCCIFNSKHMQLCSMMIGSGGFAFLNVQHQTIKLRIKIHRAIHFRCSCGHVFYLLGAFSRPASALRVRTGIRLLSGFKRMALHSERLPVLLQHYGESYSLQCDEHKISPGV